MGFWGWRPLMIAIFISVWVVGCAALPDPATDTAPTPTRPVTLTVGRIGPPGSSSTPAASAKTATPVPSQPPTDTPSPTPTATPQIYIIREGDTLLDIAIRYGIPLAELRAANSQSDLSLLQIGQQLIIPPPLPTQVMENAETAVPVLAATPTPVPLTVLLPACYDSRSEMILCLGEVENPHEMLVERVALRVQVMDAAGGVLDETITALDQVWLPPGSSAPYRAQFNLSWRTFAAAGTQIQTSLLSADAPPDAESRFARLSVEDIETRSEGDRLIVNARVVNVDTSRASDLRIVATVKDEAGQVIGYRVSAPSTSLSAGASLAVEMVIFPLARPENSSVLLYAEGSKE